MCPARAGRTEAWLGDAGGEERWGGGGGGEGGGGADRCAAV